MIRTLKLPSAELLNSIYHYNPETGALTWKVNFRSRRIGDQVGTQIKNQKDKYFRAKVKGKIYFTHRLIWKMVYGTEPEFIDHVNGNGADNRLCNLRSVPTSQNNKNKRIGKNNTSGVPGVHFRTADRRWVASVKVDNKRIYLGSFKNFDEAVAARRAAEKVHGFHENHGKDKP